MSMVHSQDKEDTRIVFIGGLNNDRIGGNCCIVEHLNKGKKAVRLMFDVGSIFPPQESGFSVAFPNMEEYFDKEDAQGEIIKAKKPIDFLFITHAHEDHIGALINYVKMGYKLPPIKTGQFTRNFIRLAFKRAGLEAPLIEKLKNRDFISFNKDIYVETMNMSHSIVDSLGFHILSCHQKAPYASILHNGDFLTEESMPVGNAFNMDAYLDLLLRKATPTTVLLLDSTSTVPYSSKRIGFEQAVKNTLEVVQKHSDKKLIISPVISRSVQNIAIDINVARALKTKVCFDGQWLLLVKEALSLSNYKDFDDVLYNGSLQSYMSDKSIPLKYIVCTGAFAQGLENYENNLGIDETSPIPMSSATKMALDLHPFVRIGKDTLVLARQRIIDEINGKTGPKMLQMMASQGATVVITPCGRKIGNFEEVQMQDSGHINAEAMKDFLAKVKAQVFNAIVVPIHGNPEQCQNTKDIADSIKMRTCIATNEDILKIGFSSVTPVKNPKSISWIATKIVLPSPTSEYQDLPPEGVTEFWEVDKDTYEPIRKICIVPNFGNQKPSDADYQKNYRIELNDERISRFKKQQEQKDQKKRKKWVKNENRVYKYPRSKVLTEAFLKRYKKDFGKN